MADFLGWPEIPGATVAVGAASTSMIDANTERTELHLDNLHATVDVWINFGNPAVVGAGFRLCAGEQKAFVKSGENEEWMCGAVYGISEVGSVNVAYADVTKP